MICANVPAFCRATHTSTHFLTLTGSLSIFYFTFPLSRVCISSPDFSSALSHCCPYPSASLLNAAMRNPFRPPVLQEAPVVDNGNGNGNNNNTTAERPVHDPEKMNLDEAVKAGEPAVVKSTHPVDIDDAGSTEGFTAGAQDGVIKIEATTTVWTRNDLIAAYILMWLITFVDALHQGSGYLMTPYVTSSFQEHSLTAYTNVMSGIMGGVLKLPLAKILDIFGRPQGFLLCTVLIMLGLTLMAACDGVQTYAAAQIFFLVGYNGMAYTISIFIADTSRLKHRGFMYAYVSSPYIATVWIVGPLSQAYLDGPGWRWFYGSFVIITLVPCAPLLLLFWWNYRKAVKAGLIVPGKSQRTFSESCTYYYHEFDIGGLFLLTGGLVFFLLPVNLYSYQEGGWNSPLVISFYVIGGLMLIGFALYEKYVAQKTFIPYELLLDRTVFGACMLAGVLFISFYLWNAYFSSFLQVVNHMNVTQTGYIVNIYSIGACFWSFIVGAAIIWTGKFKWIAVYTGVPLMFLGVGLMIHFRQADQDVGYVIMCQIFIAFAGGGLVITEQIAAMAATSHQYIAVVLAIEGMFTSIGGAIGSSIASGIWTGVFPAKLGDYLPAENQGELMTIYGDLTVQLSYAVGSPARHAIELAYSDAQKYMCISATSVLVLGLIGAMMWRDISVKDFKQVKGRVV